MKGYSPVIDWGYFDDDPQKYAGKINVIATHIPHKKPNSDAHRSSEHSLILNGHVDVVPTGPEGLMCSHTHTYTHTTSFFQSMQ
jgi:acetylornithine deacetylase/succinyl-diaminopimelate desuccinylase-like protein